MTQPSPWPNGEYERPEDLADWQAWYAGYLNSPLWRERRNLIIQRAGGRCEVCQARAAYAVHHLTYTRAGRELPDDLVAVCDRCHDDYHSRER